MRPKVNKGKESSDSEGLFSSTAKILNKTGSSLIHAYTSAKDSIRNSGQIKISPGGKKIHIKQFRDLLSKMGVDKQICSQVMENVANATTVSELTRSKKILTVLSKHGLKGKAADQFFLGGHFRLEDGGKIFKELKSLEGAEIRFSSHFADTRQEEKGISAGRILPEVLFINTVERGKTYSHFQSEASPWRMPPKENRTINAFIPERQTLQNMEHIYDSIVYFAAKQYAQYNAQTIYNRSNYGWSPYADNNPITSMNSLPTTHTEEVEDIEALLGQEPDPNSIVQSSFIEAEYNANKKESEEQNRNTL